MNPGRSRGQGRPLGLLAAWLQAAMRPELGTKAAHMAYKPTLQERREARQSLSAAEGVERFLAFERPRAEGELSEPEAIL